MVDAARVREVAGHSKMLWFLPAFAAVLGFLSFVLSTESKQEARSMAPFWAVLALVFLALSVLVAYYRHLDRAFLHWLDENRAAVLAGAAARDQHPVRSDSRVVRYGIRFGLFFLSGAFATPYRLADDSAAATDKIVATFVTAVFGWWSLPTGPIVTPVEIYRNLKGGSIQTAGDLIRALEAPPQP